jgi:hypothetical protein
MAFLNDLFSLARIEFSSDLMLKLILHSFDSEYFSKKKFISDGDRHVILSGTTTNAFGCEDAVNEISTLRRTVILIFRPLMDVFYVVN